MQYFHFKRLIERYSSGFKSITLTSGDYDDFGKWKDGEEVKVTLTGAIISHKESKIYRSEGNLTAKDKRLFTTEPIEQALLNSKIEYEGDVFRIEDNSNNAKFTGVYAYTLKFVSAFKEGGK